MKKIISTALCIGFTALLTLPLTSCNTGQAGSGTHLYASGSASSNQDYNQQKWTKESVREHVSDWKETPKKAAGKMIEKYGVPNEVTPHRLVWNNNGDFYETILTNEEIDHDFPMPHKDCLLQTVRYDTPVEKFSDIARYDGSVITERTKGTMGARCDKEPMNYLALNLAHDISQGKRSVEEARTFYAETAVAFMKGKKPPYTQGFVFSTEANSGESDEPEIEKDVIKELMKNM